MAGIGKMLEGKYRIVKELGRGGMSVVYLAEDIRLNKVWAVKEIWIEESDSSHIRSERLKAEVEVIKKLDHPVLPRIVDIIYTEKEAYLVMDYIEGTPLNKVLVDHGCIEQELVVKWAESLCEALIYLHNMNPPVIYRDMKPSNIILKNNGDIKLVDFGAALIMNTSMDMEGNNLGTKGYAAPEQYGYGLMEDRIDERTDVYGLGATVYTLLTGKLPERQGGRIMPLRVWNKNVSEGIDRIVLKCMEHDPEKRYQSIKEVLYYLKSYQRLENAFVKRCRKHIGYFLCLCMLACYFAVVSVNGYKGILEEKNDNYERKMEQGFLSVEKGDFETALAVYTEAITEIDGNRVESYLELLKLYNNYFDNPEEGLSKVTYYIDRGYKGIDNNAGLLMQVGIDYFELVKDYEKSAYYFGLIDTKECPEAEMYKTIALSMCRLDVDHRELSDILQKFENSTDSMPASIGKIRAYELMCDVYAMNGTSFEASGRRLTELAEKGLETLEEYSDESIKAYYYVAFDQYIITGCERLVEEDNDSSYYEKALFCCDEIIDMVSRDDGIITGVGKASEYRKSKLCKKAELLAKLSRTEEACQVYEAAEREYGDDALEMYVGHLSLLCSIEEQKTPDVEQWDYELLHGIYERGSNVPGIRDDYRWKRLTVKLEPLFH